jgi:hypothetical protein
LACETADFAGKVFDPNGLRVTGNALNLRGGLVVFVVFAAVGLRAGQLFEEVRVLDGGGDFVIAGGPFAEVDAAATVAAEGEVLVGGEDDGAAGGTAKRFDFRSRPFRHSTASLILWGGYGQAWDATRKCV